MSIHLDGIDISILKSIGLGGTSIPGDLLVERLSSLGEAEFVDALLSLIQIGYVESESATLHDIDAVKRTNFHVNSGYSKDLREAMNPNSRKEEKRSRRVRRE